MSDFDKLRVIQNITEANLYPKLIQQLDKDFSEVGLSNYFSDEISPQVLLTHLSTVVSGIIQRHFSTYTNLLYRIDVSEIAIKKATHSDMKIMSEQVALLILKRECQKVWLRANF
ncbi:MAG: hypothetical protein KAH07_04585 [Flavobacteriaceae bacterium]|nr:hypothetical protein [Flavobacteriaceae bacterium]